MAEKEKCLACKDGFNWDDDIVVVDEELYHKDCVTLYPTGYYAFIDDELLGETDNEDGQMAFEILEEGEYEED